MKREEIKALFPNHELSDLEVRFIETSGQRIQESKMITEIMLVRAIEKSSAEVLESNEKLQKSNDDHNKAIRCLTAALIVVGVIQVIVMLIQIFKGP